MAMSGSGGEGPQQDSFWIETQKLAKSPGHPFYKKLNALLKSKGFDAFVDEQCRPFYAENGRPSLPPGVYFRMLLIGYFEGIDSERGIAWRCADSLSLRQFLGFALDKDTPDHSTLSRIRQRLDVGTHENVFGWALNVLAAEDLIEGKTLGVDATTLEANAAMRAIVRRDTGKSYEQFLTELAKASGIETPTREDLAKVDRARKNKGSNDDWTHPHDPDARITKMKDGRTHLAHKAEHGVDMDSGAVLSVTLRHADLGDATTIYQTVTKATENLEKIVNSVPGAAETIKPYVQEVVTDKGYHSKKVTRVLEDAEIRSYLSEPARGRQKWDGQRREQQSVYANRRRIQGLRGKSLLRRRGETTERTFAHCYETGGLRRTHLRGHENILKRLLVHVVGFNLSLVFRKWFGHGTPRELAAAVFALFSLWFTGMKNRTRAIHGAPQPRIGFAVRSIQNHYVQMLTA
jgi:transposase